MLRKMLVVTLGMLILCSSVCLARISPNRVFIGGLTYGGLMSDAVRYYGNPKRTIPSEDNMHSKYDHFWGKGFMISEGRSGNITAIRVTANNGIKTVDGVAVGMDAGVISRVYGNTHDGTKYFMYHKNEYTVLQFGVNNNKITSMSIHSEM